MTVTLPPIASLPGIRWIFWNLGAALALKAPRTATTQLRISLFFMIIFFLFVMFLFFGLDIFP
jgi:hypothetical protein